ncbi:MAG: ankyrin repeat domain-containing protein [Spirochaetes bacterium]|nr:ankyrin repeat domain-containing protein [Spirochaetota bacterium]MBU0956439.1 ankyrin repeat domain-containing protein [Spirochaetota bacterium]
MKIAVVASVETLSLAKSLIQALTDHGFSAYGLKFNASWQNESRKRIDSLFKDVSHVLCVISPVVAGSSWLPFVIGYARGENRHLALYRSVADWQAPPWIRDLPVFDHEEEAQLYYTIEREEWTLMDRQRRAKSELLEMGISWHTDALFQSVKDGNIMAIELFLDSGFLPDVRDKHGVPLLCQAARSRHLSIIKLLLERGASIDMQSDDRGYTALMDATQAGDADTVHFFLSQGANPDKISKDGQTALVLAVGRGDLPVARELVEFGADPDIADKLGLSARKYAKLFKHEEICGLFGPEGCA